MGRWPATSRARGVPHLATGASRTVLLRPSALISEGTNLKSDVRSNLVFQIRMAERVLSKCLECLEEFVRPRECLMAWSGLHRLQSLFFGCCQSARSLRYEPSTLLNRANYEPEDFVVTEEAERTMLDFVDEHADLPNAGLGGEEFEVLGGPAWLWRLTEEPQSSCIASNTKVLSGIGFIRSVTAQRE